MMSSLLSLSQTFSYIGYIVIAVLVLLFMVLIHELGHYVAGKMLKFKINEFSVGFGPKIIQKTKKNGEVFSLRAIPLGGYCAFEGETEDGVSSPEAFHNQKPWKRLIVLFFGAFFNFLSAIIFSFILLLANGYDLVQVKDVDSSSINYEILQESDVIYGVNNIEIDFVKDNSFNALVTLYCKDKYKTYVGDDLTSNYSFIDDGDTYYIKTQTIPLNIKRENDKIEKVANVQVIYDSDGEFESWTFLLTEEETEEFMLGSYKYTFGESLVQCVPFTFKWAWKTILLLGDLITGNLPLTTLTGPVGTVNMIASFTQQSASFLLVMLPLIAVNLAVMNLLPIPALDGFQMIFTTIEWVRKKPLNQNVVNLINNIGLILLFGLVIVVDVLHFFIWLN